MLLFEIMILVIQLQKTKLTNIILWDDDRHSRAIGLKIFLCD
jgi:hypothetical protein